MASPFALLLDGRDQSVNSTRSQPQGERADRSAPSNDRSADPGASAREGTETKDGIEPDLPKSDVKGDVEGDGNGKVGQTGHLKVAIAGEKPAVEVSADPPADTAGASDDDAAVETKPTLETALPATATADVVAAPLAIPTPDKSTVQATPEAEHVALQAIGTRTVPDRKSETPAARDANSKNDAGPSDTSAAPAASATPAAPATEPDKDGRDGDADGKGKDTSPKPHNASSGPADKPGTEAAALKPRDSLAATPGGADAAPAKSGAEVMQNFGTWAPTAHASAATSPAAATATTSTAQPQAAAVPLTGIAVEIATLAHAGKHRFEIRLDPPELGRIDVRLDIDSDGRVTSRLVADRSETLELLRRDANQLERALQQAGLKTSDHALEFSLRQQAFTRDDTGAQSTAPAIAPEEEPAPLQPIRQGYGRLLGLGGGLDIRV